MPSHDTVIACPSDSNDDCLFDWDELLARFEVKPAELRRFCPEGDDPREDSADMITWWRYVRECHGKAPNQLRLNERSEVRREPLVASALALGYLPAIEDIVLSRVTDIDLRLDSLFKTEVYGVRGVLLAIEFLRRGGDPNDIDRRLVFNIATTHKKFEDLKSMNVSPIRVEGTLRHDPARIGPEKELSIFTGVFSRYAERVPAVRSR